MDPAMEKDNSSLEKGSGTTPNEKEDVYAQPAFVVRQDDERYHFDAADLDRVQRRLGQRHVQMIAIAGTIGTGLFLGSGHALAVAGPLGMLIAYAIIGTVAFSSLCAVGEMTAHAPISGTFPHFAARWVDPALGFAVGWNYFYTNAITFPTEIVAATILLSFWDQNLNHQGIYLAVLCILCSAINLFGVRYFGESEVVFSCIKLMLITGLIIGGLVVSLGGGPDHTRHGFQFWRNPGPIAQLHVGKGGPDGNGYDVKGSAGRFLAVIATFLQAAFSFQGMELVAIAASETKNPRRNIGKAVRRVYFRIIIFYLLGVLVTGMLVAYNDPHLLVSTNTAAESPYVIAFSNAGIKGLPHVINAGVFTSAFSAGNSFLFCASRILYGLSLRGQAPRVFTKCTKNGLPWVAVSATALFSLLSFLSLGGTASTAFLWLQSLTTVGGFFAWGTINFTYLRFYYGAKAQGIDRKKFVYFSNLQPYLAYWGTFWNILLILINGFTVFMHEQWDTPTFVTSYLNIPLFIALYFGWKIFKRTKVWKASEMDFWTGIPSIEETEGDYVPPRTTLGKIADTIL